MLQLASVSGEKGDDHLKQLYVWRHDRASTTAKAFAGLGASLTVALVAALLQARLTAPWWQSALGFVGAGLLLGVGSYRYWLLNRSSTDYVAALSLLRRAEQIRPFLTRYEEVQ